MPWTKTLISISLLALMSGCANQDNMMPQNGDDMISIYRNAIHENGGNSAPSAYADEAQALCAELVDDEDIPKCLKQAHRVLERSRLSISANPNGEVMEYSPYSRDTKNEIEQLFPRMPNPDLVVYVYPHLATKSRAPVPGYSSVIPLFERVEYRLPGETVSPE